MSRFYLSNYHVFNNILINDGIDGTDNADYFLYRFNISKKDQKRLLFLNNLLSGGKCNPRSPKLKAPKIESVIA